MFKIAIKKYFLTQIHANLTQIYADSLSATICVPASANRPLRPRSEARRRDGQSAKICVKTVLFLTLILHLIFTSVGFAGIEDVHSFYLDKEYDRAIEEAQRILNSFSLRSEAAEAYFYLGLSQTKLGYFQEARESFRTIIKSFPKSDFIERAYLSLADCFFLEENYTKAAEIYKSFLEQYPNSDLLQIAYFRLGQTHLKLGDWQIAKDYIKELTKRFPNSLEVKESNELISRDNFFTVQVGAFINQDSAKELGDKLEKDGFDSYLVKTTTDDGKNLFRVRVGKLSSRYDAEALQAALALKGYPTRIYP